MRIIVDTNIVFSAILNSNSRIASILLQLKSKHRFYTTYQLLTEIEEHRNKLKKLTLLSDLELSNLILITTRPIRFINIQLVPFKIYKKIQALTNDVDEDDTDFVALAEHLNAKLWTGDKVLINGLTQKGWNKFISTSELFQIFLADE